MLCVFAFMSPSGRSDNESWALRTVGLWLVLPPLLTLAATPLKPLFAPYMLVMCVPGLIILAARGITNLLEASWVQRLAGAAACVLVMILSLASLKRPVHYEYVPHANWRAAIDHGLAHQEPDGAVFYIPNDYPYLYYVRRAESKCCARHLVSPCRMAALNPRRSEPGNFGTQTRVAHSVSRFCSF